tara:strand:+ start:3083 stop:3391 length:309 start_codon:yes stop_codon:yes gene_type:complete
MPQGKGTYGSKVGRPRKQATEREGGIDKEISNLLKESDKQDKDKVREKILKKIKKGSKYKFMYFKKPREGIFKGTVGTGRGMRAAFDLDGKLVNVKLEMIAV